MELCLIGQNDVKQAWVSRDWRNMWVCVWGKHGEVGVEVLVSAHNKDWLLVCECGRGMCVYTHPCAYLSVTAHIRTCVCVCKTARFIHFVSVRKPACDCLASLCAGPWSTALYGKQERFPWKEEFPQQPPIAVMVVVMSCSCQSSFRLSSLIHVPAAQHLQLEQMFTPMKTRQTRPARLTAPTE